MQIEIKVSELDLSDVQEGDKVRIEFEWDADGELSLEGTIAAISHVGAEKEGASGGDAAYSAYVDFTPVDSVRLDMSVIVYVLDGDTDDFEDAAEIEE